MCTDKMCYVYIRLLTSRSNFINISVGHVIQTSNLITMYMSHTLPWICVQLTVYCMYSVDFFFFWVSFI